MRVLLPLLLLTAASGPAFAEYIETRNLELDAEGLESLRIESDAGDVFVMGNPDAKQITVEAKIIVRGVANGEKVVQENLRLELDRSGSRAHLRAAMDNRGFIRSLLSLGHSASIDLRVDAPASLALDINDDSGDITIRKMDGEIVVDDDSGDIDIREAASTVRIDDDSGDIILREIGGHVDIDDDSGDVDAENVFGNVEIDDDSGDITLRHISGDVEIWDDSGSIDVYDVKGSVTVDDDSGSIHIDSVEKDVTILDNDSGHATIENVKGTVTNRSEDG